MAHATLKTAYSRLSNRINRFPQGAPPSELLFKILELLLSEKEADLISNLPIRPFTATQAAKIWKMDLRKAENVLNELADRAILVDMPSPGGTQYVLPPPMAGFFEFSMMRLREDIDQKVLSELFYEYLNVEEDFIRELFTVGETQLGRTFVYEPALSNENALHVLDYERASDVIKTASHRGVGMCYCRHKMQHLGKNCDAPMDICMTFNSTADSLIRHGVARSVDKSECLDLLQEAYDNRLVQFGENVQERVNFICNCCGCCCEAMIAARRFSILNPVHTTGFLPQVCDEVCNGCGRCVDVCPVEAMALVSRNDPHKPKQKRADLNESTCLGCGLCVKVCNKEAISLVERGKRVLTPVNGTHRAVMMAIERGKLQNLIFDNQALWSHRALAGIFGAILNLPPVSQVLASEQIKSRYLGRLLQEKKQV